MKRKLDARAILADLRSGLDGKGLMEKYGLSSQELKSALRQLADERQARSEAFARDLVSGMSDAELLKKYQLSLNGFQRILTGLLAAGLITLDEILKRGSQAHDVIIDLRISPRFEPILTAMAFELSHPHKTFEIKDISVKGLAVKGLETRVGDVKRIAVLGDDLGITVPFEFEADCRWITAELPGDSPAAGFEITNISRDNMGRLKDFIRTATRMAQSGLGR